MKKKILFVLVLAVSMVLALAIGASAASVTDDSTNMTLGDCTINGLDGVTIPSPTRGLVYELDDETSTATVTGRGTFTGGSLVFPSSVTYNGKTYAVTKINSGLFQALTYDLYIPDSITFIAGGGNVGTFGNSKIDKAYIGSGLTGFERETFSGSKGFNTFVCKSKPTYIGVYAFNSVSTTAETLGNYEFDLSQVTRFDDMAFSNANFVRELVLNENVSYIGSNAFVKASRLYGSITIPSTCTISACCFNGTSIDRVIIKVAPGETKKLPTEMFSGASGTIEVIIDGPAVADGNHILPGHTASMLIYMEKYSYIVDLVNSIKGKSGNDRLAYVTFYCCETGKYYTANSSGTISDGVDLESNHIYSNEPVFFDKNCTSVERYSYVCLVCEAEKLVSQGTELGKHVIEATVKEPTCQSDGYIYNKCTVCDYEETIHFIGKNTHSGTTVTYKKEDYQTLIETTKCEFCNETLSVNRVSLVNKCYIEGYGLFDATLDYVSVDHDGVATPNPNATFNNAEIYFPSCVIVNDRVVEVVTVAGFKAKSIKSIYIPDSVTRIAGGSGVGCFGDISSLKNIVVGSGVTALEQEVFCMGNGASLEKFIFKGTITEMRLFCLSKVSAANNDISYEFKTNLSYVGKQVNVGGNIVREVTIAQGCDLSEKFAFNNANGLKTVYIYGGNTKADALDLGQEFASNTATVNYYIKGYVTVSGQAVLAGHSNTRIYMESADAIEYFVEAISKQNYNDRIEKAVFMDCGTNTALYFDRNANKSVSESVAYSHGGVVVTIESSCTSAGVQIVKCFVCDETVSSTELELKEHEFDGGVITLMPTESANGIIVYTCFGCGATEEEEITKALGTHNEIVTIYYLNGFTKQGYAEIYCADCDHTEVRILDAMFEVHGFSVKQDGTGITYGYSINVSAMSYYEKHMGKVSYGIILANAHDVRDNGLLDEEFNFIEDNRGFKLDIEYRTLKSLDVRVEGAVTDAIRALDFLLTAYIVADKNADGVAEIEYMQYSMQNGDNKPITLGDVVLSTISIDRAIEATKKIK